ncbi:MAG: hypothetical protein WCE69_16810 [Aestuariivirga sp.]
MRIPFGLAIVGLFLVTTAVNGANLCNCCATGVAANCGAVCGSAKPAPAQCVAMLDHAGQPTIAPGENPLYGLSLQNMPLDNVTQPQMEDFRKLLENSRRGLEKDRKATIRDFRKHKIDDAAVKAGTKRYEDAIVNYYLGLRAYRDRLAAAPKT